jgi:hypothetical protein
VWTALALINSAQDCPSSIFDLSAPDGPYDVVIDDGVVPKQFFNSLGSKPSMLPAARIDWRCMRFL